MEEQVNQNSEVNQVAPAENATHVAEQQPQQQPAEAKAEDNQERNWKEMRRQKADLERKLKMQDEMLERLMKSSPQAPQQPQEVDELDQMDDNEIIDKAKYKKLREKDLLQARKAAQEEIEKVLQKQHQSQFMTRLKAQFSDFDEVVNQETLALLEEQEPELAETIASAQDPYKIGLATYKYLKKSGISDKVPTARHAKEVERKIDQNQKTVQSPQAYDKRPMAAAFRMTESMRKELADEMNLYARQASSVPELR